jgi:hypothetical protein
MIKRTRTVTHVAQSHTMRIHILFYTRACYHRPTPVLVSGMVKITGQSDTLEMALLSFVIARDCKDMRCVLAPQSYCFVTNR